jgi:hypothetical protein
MLGSLEPLSIGERILRAIIDCCWLNAEQPASVGS